MQSYRENVFEKLAHLEALDGFNKDGDEWSVLDEWELREDEDYWLAHNPDMEDETDLYYTTETMKMRKDGDDSSEGSHSQNSEKQSEPVRSDPESSNKSDSKSNDSGPKD